MFKNVTNLVKFKNQLTEIKKESKKKAKKEAKKKATKSAERVVTFQEPVDVLPATVTTSIATPSEEEEEECENLLFDLAQQEDESTTTTTTTKPQEVAKNGNFLSRQGRKKFALMAERLRRIKSFTVRTTRAKQDNNNSNSDSNSILNGGSAVILEEKPKFVIDYEEQRLAASKFAQGPNPDWDSENSDDDDAYETAEESFDDCDTADQTAGAAARQPVANDQQAVANSSTQRYVSGGSGRDEKFIMPEELADIPTFLNTRDCERDIIDETRTLLRERYEKNPDSFYEEDYARMISDDWTVSRFLLRRRQDPKRTAQLMENCGKFRKQYMMSRAQRWEFPAEFHLAGGLFQYAPDRVGNTTMYMRIKMYKRVPEISDLFKSLILCVLEQCDVSTGGRGTAIVFDLTDCGLQNVDLGFLYWLLNSFRNYCPKGVSYILVLNLPWFLSATAKLAMTWMSATNRRALRFVQGKEIEDFIAPENIPDYLNGTCQQDYRVIPRGSQPARHFKKTPNVDVNSVQAEKIRDLFKQWLPKEYEKKLLCSENDISTSEGVDESR